MENRTNDRYVISDEVKKAVYEIQPKWKNKTVSRRLSHPTQRRKSRATTLARVCFLTGSLSTPVSPCLRKLRKALKHRLRRYCRKRVEEKLAELDTVRPEDVKSVSFTLPS